MLLNQDQDLLADLSIAICSSFRCVSISRTYPGVSLLADLLSVTLSDFHCVGVALFTERLWTTGHDIFSECYDEQLSYFDFQSVFSKSLILRCVPGLRIF